MRKLNKKREKAVNSKQERKEEKEKEEQELKRIYRETQKYDENEAKAKINTGEKRK